MKRISLPLSEMSFAQKLDLMEVMWADLARDEGKVKSPAWHKAVLSDREKALGSGQATLSDWEEAKKDIRERLS